MDHAGVDAGVDGTHSVGTKYVRVEGAARNINTVILVDNMEDGGAPKLQLPTLSPSLPPPPPPTYRPPVIN